MKKIILNDETILEQVHMNVKFDQKFITDIVTDGSISINDTITIFDGSDIVFDGHIETIKPRGIDILITVVPNPDFVRLKTKIELIKLEIEEEINNRKKDKEMII